MTAAGVLALLLGWEIASLALGSDILLPSPLEAAGKLLSLCLSPRFAEALFHSFLRVMLSLIISCPLGIALGLLMGLHPLFRRFMGPLMMVISSTPVMALILILFLWAGSENTPAVTGFLMIFPVMAGNTREGIQSVSPEYRELFRSYNIEQIDTLRFLYLPSVLPFIIGGLRSSLSLSWKVVVAAEVLVQPLRALGTGMQEAKAQLETAELFAWTAAAVIAAALSQGALSGILRLSRRRGKGGD